MIGALFYKLGAFFARHLPPRISESVTEFLLRAQYLFRFGPRRNVMRNLVIVMGENLGEAERRAITKRVFSNFAKSIYYFLRLPSMDSGQLKAHCDYNGIEQVTKQLMNNGGFIIVGPHVGPWEVGGAALSALGVRLHTVALQHPSRYVTRFFDRHRRKVGIECESGGESVESLRQALRQGESVALLVDRPYGRMNRRCRWFDRPADLPSGHTALAVRFGVPIITSVCVFDGNGGFKFLHGGPHYPDPKLDHESAMQDLQQKCADDMERFIRQHPDQWFQFSPMGA